MVDIHHTSAGRNWLYEHRWLCFMKKGKKQNNCNTPFMLFLKIRKNEICNNKKVCLCSTVSDFLQPYGACQASLSMGFPMQEYWSELLFPTPGDLPDSGNKPESLAPPVLPGGFFTTEPPGKSSKV